MFDFDDLEEEEEKVKEEVAAEAPVAAAEAPAAAAEERAPAAAEAAEAAGGVDEELKRKVELEAKACQERGDLALWAFKYPVLGFPLPPGTCKFRIFAFHNAGSAESVWTGPAMNPMFTWVKNSKAVELVAVSYPGRDKMLHTKGSKMYPSTDELNAAMLPVLLPLISDGVPFLFLAHSVGTWVSFELLMLMRRIGAPMPKACIFNGFCHPDMPEARRPWRRSATLDKTEFIKEFKQWDMGHLDGRGKFIFDEPAWTEMWEPIMRNDFRLFDEYTFGHAGAPKFDFPIHAMHMEGDFNIKEDMVSAWGTWSDDFHFEVIKGMGHLTCIYIPASKKAYFERVLAVIQKYAAI